MKKEGYLQKSRAYKGFHYSVLRQDQIQYLHDRTLEMMKIIIPILQKHDIKYMICGGTLLGAATTGKFIPWDDDFDVCVFQEDYNRMIDILIKEIPEVGGKNIVVQCSKTEPHYYLDWIKIRDTRSHVYPDIPNYKDNGVWIDIYKLVPAKDKNVEYIIAKGHLDYNRRRYEQGGLTKEQYYERIKQNNLKSNVYKAKIKSFFKPYKEDVCIIWSASKVFLKQEWILPLKEFTFEGITMTSFGKAEKYLTQHYGDEYELLPKDELRRVGINNIDFPQSQ